MIMPTAVVTGASMGIGAAFARALAKRKYDLVLVARSQDKLGALSHELMTNYGVQVKVWVADLTAATAATDVFNAVKSWDWQVDLLVNNAGFGDYAPFVTCDRAKQISMIQLNVLALTELTHLFLPSMIDRKSGSIINVASIAGLQSLPYLSVYAATKAFVVSFSESLWAEVKASGVKVQALCPGSTESNFAVVAGMDTMMEGSTKEPPKMATAESVVKESLDALEHNEPIVVTGIGNRVVSAIGRFVPRKTLVGWVEQVFRPKV
jgi:uncharacterized protein